ncbi:fibronectin type III domain-containing protein [Ditylenchus destructor]|nr:fibronectin type III domain-containing protein [Ditylenchus destructor]
MASRNMASRGNSRTKRKLWCLWRVSVIFFAQFSGLFIGLCGAQRSSQRVPSAPKNVDLTQINASSIKVSWEPPDNEGDSEILGYNVYKDKKVNGQVVRNGLRKAVAVVDKNKLYTFINDLEPNSEYDIRVAAINMNGDGQHSPAKKIVTGGRPPSKPRTQSIRLVSEEKPIKAKIDWLPPQHTYGLPIQKYLIWYKPIDLNSYEKAEAGPNDLSFVLDNLHNGQEYELLIAAVNEVGMSENATERWVTPAGIPDGEPLNIRYTIFKNHLTILWDPPIWFHRNGNITQYKVVFKSVQGRNSGQIIEKNVTGQSIVFEIDPKTSYNFKVAAATIRGQGPYSATLSINSNINCKCTFVKAFGYY